MTARNRTCLTHLIDNKIAAEATTARMEMGVSSKILISNGLAIIAPAEIWLIKLVSALTKA